MQATQPTKPTYQAPIATQTEQANSNSKKHAKNKSVIIMSRDHIPTGFSGAKDQRSQRNRGNHSSHSHSQSQSISQTSIGHQPYQLLPKRRTQQKYKQKPSFKMNSGQKRNKPGHVHHKSLVTSQKSVTMGSFLRST